MSGAIPPLIIYLHGVDGDNFTVTFKTFLGLRISVYLTIQNTRLQIEMYA